MPAALSHLVGFDDAPFARDSREQVIVVGAVYAGARLEGVLSTRVSRDGDDATDALIQLLSRSRFLPQLHACLLQGIAFGGFNVVDVRRLAAAVGKPVLVVARRRPDLAAIHAALLQRVAGGDGKWRRIEQAGPMEPLANVWVQREGLTPAAAERLIRASARHGRLPEPLRTAHLIAGGLAGGGSRQRA